MRLFVLFISLFSCFFYGYGQILHTENFALILDTTKFFKGNVLPSFKYQNLKEDLIQVQNNADFSFRFGQSAFTIANRFELSRFGEEDLQSGGYVYVEYRSLSKKSKWSIEPYFQAHFAEVRGLERKYAAGANARIALVENPVNGLFIGGGPFYEFERWGYSGVNDALIPSNPTVIENEQVRFGAYLSYKLNLSARFIFDLSAYYQNFIDRPFVNPRLASSLRATYKVTKYLGLTFSHQSIYDPTPVVPIDRLFQDINFGLSINI